MDDFELEIKTEFLNEALMNLEEVEGSFMELESASDTKPLLDKIFRLAHNLKGGSRAVGFGEVAEFTHQLESLVLKIQKGEVSLTRNIITTLLKSNDRLVEMLTGLKADMAATFDTSDLLQEIMGWLNGTPVAAEASHEPVAAAQPAPKAEPSLTEVPSADAFHMTEDTNLINDNKSLNDEIETAKSDLIQETSVTTEPISSAIINVAPSAAVAKSPAKNDNTNSKNQSKPKDDEVVRVNISKIDLLNDYVGELIVLQSVVQQQALSNPDKLQVSIRQMVKLSKDIQSLSMGFRMLPVKPLIQKLQRVVRDTAQALNKDVNFEVVGEHMEIDKSVMDRLADPLIHIVRNAVDHGLETTEERIKAGKTSQGKIVLSISNEGNHLVLEVKDDGKGINSEIIRSKAIEKNIIQENQPLTEKQIINLIFHPGFSTKAVTSEISGRGVGMDVVKTNVEKIGGHVDVTTNIGNGSLFKLQIPLSLAVVEGLVVTSENNRYVVPLNQVQETINLKSQKVHSAKLGVGSCFELRGKVVPLFVFDEVIEARKSLKPITEGTALIINVEDHPIALVVTDIVRAQQIVIKPFSNGLAAQKGWVGTCVLGDGLPTLIINPVDLLSGKISQSMGEHKIGSAA